ncbi:MAG: Gfo/Idh/MocA family oxidoreductase [Bacteroidia bacterium]|nr:Gfo/Idh/MocA family oxidoreductase [Bacteroidia bacterium]
MTKKILLVGAGPMAVDYFKVLKALNYEVTVVGRSEKSALDFESKTGQKAFAGGLTSFLKSSVSEFEAAIVAVGVEQLASATAELINHGVVSILVEKPAGMNRKEIEELAILASSKKANVFVAYNRRFYSSVLKAEEIIKTDGGVSSFNFEFTEWAHVIEPLQKAPGVKETWLLANSTHVIDLAFYLGGKPAVMNSYTSGQLSWHKHSVYSGAGRSVTGALFSYQANWEAPGRWVLELLTKNFRLIFKPMEELQVQVKGSVAINKVEIDNTFDTQFKPGLYRQTEAFLGKEYFKLKSIASQLEDAKIYEQIALG